ncbi:DUF4189 domain-containing protein [Bacillus sp. NP157]|nr:DUF4189 domain-containing protein [Bacillus sp. NP157]
MISKPTTAICLAVFFMPALAVAQCATGVDTGGGNCIPPEQLGVNGSQPAANVPPPPSWESRWGAVVMDKGTGNTGVANDMSSERDAVSKATADCRSDGSRDCEVVQSFKNTCVGIASAPQYFGKATNTDLEKARSDAMMACEGGSKACTLIYSACSYPVRLR